MQVPGIAALLVCGLVSCQSHGGTTQSAAPAKVAWSYAGSNGPEHWGDLSPAYALAKSGKRQSPIDIASARVHTHDAPPLKVDYRPTALEILNNGHTVEDEYHEGGTLTVDGHVYDLAQFHFHSPSEHTIDGRHAPLEMHLVHKDASGNLAVIGVLFREGKQHAELAKLSSHLPASAGSTKNVEGVRVNPSTLLPASLASYRYPGSLTTPPCSEGVAWFVLQEPIEASPEQIAAFRKVIGGNNRPTQPLNDRVITGSR